VSFAATPGGKSACPDPQQLLATTLQRLEALPAADATLWTDGHADEGIKDGGAGALLELRGDRVELSEAAGRWCSSFRAECQALEAGLRLLAERLQELSGSEVSEVRVCTDSLSALQALEAGPGAIRHAGLVRVWRELERCAAEGRHFTFVWVPGHVGLPGNEAADALARAGGSMPQSEVPVDFSCAKAAIRRAGAALHDAWYRGQLPADHHHRRATDGRAFDSTSCSNSAEERHLVRLRVNRHPFCRATLARWGRPAQPSLSTATPFPSTVTNNITNINITPTLPFCAFCPGVVDDAEHFLCHCQRWSAQRAACLGPTPTVAVLRHFPGNVVAFLRAVRLLHGGPEIAAVSRQPP
jgi:ribonuclease HI